MPLQVSLSSHSWGSGWPSHLHRPLWQVSLPLHGFPSLQPAPSGRAVCLQLPRVLSQPSVVHGSPSSQFGGVPLWQTPPKQVSAPLQTLPSLQEVPLGGAWPAVQTPERQVSRPLQTKPSLHAAPSGGTAPLTQTPAWQVSTPLQGSASPHAVPFGGSGPGVHTPAWQVSRPLH